MLKVFLLIAAITVASVGVHAQNAAAPPSSAPSTANGSVTAQTSSSYSGQSSQTNSSSQDRAHDNPAAPPTGNRRDGIKANNADEAGDDGAGAQLPQTSTILPLLGLIGLGSLVAGLFARR